jgi:hypothetical protein
MRPLLSDYAMWETFGVRALMFALDRGADFGECVTPVGRVPEGDLDTWHREWVATGDRIAAIGDASAEAGHRVSAREAYYRACNYYRVSYLPRPLKKASGRRLRRLGPRQIEFTRPWASTSSVITQRRPRAAMAPVGRPRGCHTGHDAGPTRSLPRSASGSGLPQSAAPGCWRSASLGVAAVVGHATPSPRRTAARPSPIASGSLSCTARWRGSCAPSPGSRCRTSAAPCGHGRWSCTSA